MSDMSVFDLFRRFFHPPGMRDPFFGGMTQDDDDEDDDEDDDDFFSRAPSSWRGQPQPRFPDPFGFEEFFRDFNEMFADFGAMIPDAPRLQGSEPAARAPGRSGGSLRDFMLKYPDSHLPRDQTPMSQGPSTGEGPQQPGWGDDGGTVPPGDTKQDKILDSEVSSRGLDSILRSKQPSAPSPSAYFRSVSVSRVMRPDGTVEERRTVRDGEGNVTTTVTVTRGEEVISSETSDPYRGALINEKDSSLIPHRSLPDLSDSQTILSRIFQRWFSS